LPLHIDRAVWIYRRDLAAQAISLAIARQTRQWASVHAPAGVARYGYRRIIRAAKELRAQNLEWQRHFDRQPAGFVIRISYENLIRTPDEEFKKLLNFLDPTVRAVGFHPKTEKQVDNRKKQWLARLEDDLKEADAWITIPQSFE